MSYQPPTDQNAILMMRFAVIAYDSPQAIPIDVSTQIPPANGSWTCVWGPYTDSIIAINALAYIVQNKQSNEYAVVMRGTTPSSLTDWHFDLETWPIVSLNPYIPIAPTTGLMTATGSLDEFQKIISLGAGKTLLDYFTGLSTAPARVFVTGHSLGGTMAALVAAYLKAQFVANQKLQSVVVQPYTFAAFTPGNQLLAAYLDMLFGSDSGLAPAWRYYNVLDVAPILWTSLSGVQELYPYGFHGIGPDEIARSFRKIPSTQGQLYVQPQQGGFALSGQFLKESWIGLESRWDREAGFQHSHIASYLPLMLGEPQAIPVATAAG
jgi:hypothetical protein